MVRVFHDAQKLPMPLSAQVLEVACNFKLMGLAGLKSLAGQQATTASDCYFVGMACFLVGADPTSDIGQFLLAMTSFTKLKLGDFKSTAVRLLRRAAADEPHHYWSHYWLAWTLEEYDRKDKTAKRLADLRGAEIALTNCVALRPEYGLSYAKRGKVLALQYSHLSDSNTAKSADDLEGKEVEQRAAADAARAAQLDPHDYFLQYLRCETYALLARWEECLDALGQLLPLLPTEDTPANRRLADQTNILREAEMGLNRFAQNQPGRADVWSLLALARLSLGKDEASLEAATKALDLTEAPGQAATVRERALAVRGMVSLRRNDAAKALADFDVVLARKQDHFLAACGRARVQEMRQEWSAALASYESLAKIAIVDEQRVAAQLGQARALVQLGRVNEARQALARARELDAHAAAEAAKLLPPAPGQ
jgi:tetratricopeptide (TPR) repeat protein